MLFDDLESLEATIGFVRADLRGNGVEATAGTFRDDQDPEVDRLFNGSPLLETAATFDEMHMRMERPVRSRAQSDAEPEEKHEEQKPVANIRPQFDVSTSTQNLFEKIQVFAPPTEVSGLSRLLAQGANDVEQSDANANMVLTIYFPDRSSTDVKVHDSNTVDEVIRKALAVHKGAGMEPPLLYAAPECYEIRLHEGDGFADEDFPALDRERQLKKFGDVQEYCLCQIEGAVPTGGGHERGADSVFDSPLNRFLINIKMPKNMYVKKKLSDTTTARDLLNMIARTHILRLYTDEYIFALSAEDQVRLGLVSPVVREDIPILSLGVQELSLQRKVYADAPKVHTSKLNATNDSEPESRPDPDSMMFKFNDVTAAVYQEWNIVKKNKFGRRQERVMGVDAHKIYNSKKEGRNVVTAVYRAHRNITAIKDICYVPDDVRAFRITFDDDGEIVSVEYQAENPRLCAEIVSKIKYIMRYLHSNTAT